MGKTKRDIVQIHKSDKEEGLGTKVDDYRYVLDSINSWIISADNKVSIYCGMYSVVIAVIAFVADHVLSVIGEKSAEINQTAYVWLVVLTIIAIISFLISIVFYSWAVKPNLICDNNTQDKDKLSLFYRDIAQFKSPEEFVHTVEETDRDGYLTEIVTEVYYNSKVCTSKMIRFQVAIILSTISVIATVFACIAFYYTFY